MTEAVAVNLAAYFIAIAFGIFAILKWRRQDVPVLAGLGLTIDRRTVPDIGAGLTIATAAMTGVLVVELMLGVASATGGAFGPVAVLEFGLFLILSGLVDEILMRGMLVSGLALLLGGRPLAAVLIASVLFGSTHIFFEGASTLSLISNSLGGVMYGLAFILTGRIWLGLGLHFAWNFVQGPILGFILSGHPVDHALFHVDDLGPVWLTGGLYGPEGGIVGIGFRFVVIGAVVVWVRIDSRLGKKDSALHPNPAG
jgi:membrane protease YdiL (CAAX protease family)